MKGLKRSVSPGAAALLVIIVLAVIQYVWWRGLVYKPKGPPGAGGPSAMPRPGPQDINVKGHDYVLVDTYSGDIEPGDVDGQEYIARFDRPSALAIDNSGKLFVCDTGNHKIKVVAANGAVTTLAGNGQGYQDGPVADAKFSGPCGIAVTRDGTLYVSDTGNGKIREIKGGVVSTVVNAPGTMPIGIAYRDSAEPVISFVDGITETLFTYDMHGILKQKIPHPGSNQVTSSDVLGTPSNTGKLAALTVKGADDFPATAKSTKMNHQNGWCPVPNGALATDGASSAVFLIRGTVGEVIAGDVNSQRTALGWKDGKGDDCIFYNPTGVASDGQKYAYVTDTGNNCIRRLTLPDFLLK